MNNIIQISYKYYNEALKLIKSNNISQAKIKLEKSIKLYGIDTQVLNLLASCEYLLCNFNKANLYWSKSLNINYEQDKVRDYVEQLNSEKFKKLLKKYNEAIKCIHNEDYNNSIDLLNEVIDIDSNLIEPYYIIGLCLINDGKIDKGLHYLKIASKKDNGNLKYLKLINQVSDNYTTHKENKIKNSNKYKTLIIYNVMILTLIASSFIFIMNQNNKKYENLIENEKYNYESVRSQLNNRENEITNLQKEIESFNQIGLDAYKEIYINSLNYYRNKDYKNAINGFEYISKNKELDNYLKAESIYLTALCYENIGSYELAIDYYKLYMKEYPDGNYYDYSLYNIQKINTKHK